MFTEIAEAPAARNIVPFDEVAYRPLLVQIFRSIDEPDGYCGVETLDDFNSQLDRYEFQQDW
jgi:hypothetical protein